MMAVLHLVASLSSSLMFVILLFQCLPHSVSSSIARIDYYYQPHLASSSGNTIESMHAIFIIVD